MNKIKCVCEVCGRTEILTPEEAYQQGWDYPPYMGYLRCGLRPDCLITETVWAALVLDKKPMWELSERQVEAISRILAEPESLIPEDGKT